METVVEELTTALLNAHRMLGIKAAVLVNGHGGNIPLREKIPDLEKKVGIRVVLNNTLVEIEGPHAATGELSMGATMNIVNLSKLTEHSDFTQYPEVGFVGMTEVRRKYDWADKRANEVTRLGIRTSHYLGEKLLECAIVDTINNINEI